jgi:hypothetical protein
MMIILSSSVFDINMRIVYTILFFSFQEHEVVMRGMRSTLASRIYKNGVKQSASGAVSPDPQWSIPMFRANFLCFASKMALVHLQWENSTTGKTEALERCVEGSVAQLFH